MLKFYSFWVFCGFVFSLTGGAIIREPFPKYIEPFSKATREFVTDGSSTEEQSTLPLTLYPSQYPIKFVKFDWPTSPFYNPYYYNPSYLTHQKYDPASSFNFFQQLAQYFSQIPLWFSLNFNPISSPFFGYPFFTSPQISSVSSFSKPASTEGSSSINAAQTSPTGSQPVYSSSSSFSSSSGPGQHVSGGHVSTSGGGKPIEEHYFVSSNGENVHISSTDGSKGPSSTSTVRQRRFVDPRANPIEAGLIAAQGVQAGLSAVSHGVQTGVVLATQGFQAALASVQHGIEAGALTAQQGINAGISSGLQG